MRIAGHYGTGLDRAACARRPVYQDTEPTPAESRSLIVHPAAAASSPSIAMPARSHAALLAQLIAKAQDLPVSRERRRADPLESANIYRAIAGVDRVNEKKSLRLI